MEPNFKVLVDGTSAMAQLFSRRSLSVNQTTHSNTPQTFSLPLLMTLRDAMPRRVATTILPLLSLCLLLTTCSSVKKNAKLTHPVIKSHAVAFNESKLKPTIRLQEPDYLTHQEAVTLSQNQNGQPDDTLSKKLETFWRTPVISNEAWFSGIRPVQQSTPHLGPILRVASWNIEKSLHIREAIAALQSEESYLPLIDPRKAPEGSQKRRTMLRQRERLATADVIFLQEMDIGVTRSNYIDAARELAKALGMNYAYAAQSLEVDPVQLGLEPHPDLPPFQASKYKGVFGSAILSRYPILKVETFQLKHQPYDWYSNELQEHGIIEKGRRLGSAIVFENEITREVKIGGRNFFRVDIAVPQVPGGVVTLINNHLEIKTRPQHRQQQMEEILGYIKDIPHPIIMAGDHNSAPEDLSPTSLKRIVKRQVDNPSNLLSTAATICDLVIDVVVPYYRERGIINSIKNYQNPLAIDIPILLPNSVRGLFEAVEEHRFHDGTAFDFRGDRQHSINRRGGILANSNEKRFWGHRTTFSVRRPIGMIGRYRLDWIFVRSGKLKHPREKNASYWFAPHFGETLAEFNEALNPKISDHRPIIIDLPLSEPEENRE